MKFKTAKCLQKSICDQQKAMYLKKNQKVSLINNSDIEKIGKYLFKFSFGALTKKQDTEVYNYFNYIYFLVKEGLLNLPIDVLYDDSPDFTLSFPGFSIGLEVTMATDKGYQHAIAVAAKEFPEGSLIEMPEYGSNTTSKETVRKGIRQSDEELQSSGWGDYGQEKLWVKCIERSIKEKTELLNKLHFKKFDANELIIYDETPTDFHRLDYAIPKLHEVFRSQKKMSGAKRFDKTHVITGNLLIYDLFGNCRDIDRSKSKV